MKALVTVCVSVLILLTGCGSRAKFPESRPVKTPQEVFARLAEAMYTVDRTEMIACFTGTDEEKKAIGSLATFGAASLSFKTAFIKAYGQEEWDAFQDPERSPEEGSARLNLVTEDKLKEMKSAAIRIEGSNAFVSIPNESREATILKDGNGWLIQASSFLPPGAEPSAFSRTMDTLAATIMKYQKAVGQRGISGEDIDAELGRAMTEEIFGLTITAKHRFDIDAIK